MAERTFYEAANVYSINFLAAGLRAIGSARLNELVQAGRVPESALGRCIINRNSEPAASFRPRSRLQSRPNLSESSGSGAGIQAGIVPGKGDHASIREQRPRLGPDRQDNQAGGPRPSDNLYGTARSGYTLLHFHGRPFLKGSRQGGGPQGVHWRGRRRR